MVRNFGDRFKHLVAKTSAVAPRPALEIRHLVLPLVSSAWMVLACLWLVLEPQLSLRIPFLELGFTWIPIAASTVLIGFVAVDAFGQLLRHGQHRILFGDVLILLMLFTIVFMQLSTHADALHFAHQFAATPLDWLLFSLGNALRAADLADALKDYGVYVPQITPNSWFACSLLIAYRLIIDILFLSYALLTVKRVGEWITKAITEMANSVIELHMIYLLCWVIFLLCWVGTALWWSPWLVKDQILWPVDNLLRVVDVFDAMQIFGIRFDSVPHGPWEITLGIVLRLLVAIALASPLSTLQTRFEKYFRTEILHLNSRHAAPLKQEDHARATMSFRLSLASVIVFSIGMVGVAKLSGSTHQQLVQSAVSEHDIHSHQIIRRLGINCSPGAMHVLHEVAVDQSRGEEERLQATETLAYFGSAAADLLVDSLRTNPALATRIFDSLVRVGPSSSSAMVSVLAENDRDMRRQALAQLQDWGGDSISYLAPQVDGENTVYFYTLFDEIDPYWDRRRGSGRWFRQLVDAKRFYRSLEPAVDGLFIKTSLAKSRKLADSVGRITMQMRWTPPAVAGQLMRVEVFMNSANYMKIRKDWVQNDRRRQGPSKLGEGAQYESDGIGQAKKHLYGAVKRHPETAIDVLLTYRASGERMYEEAAKECLQDVLGPEYEQIVRQHQSRGLQQRAFSIEDHPTGPQWSPPDVRQVLIDAGLDKEARLRIPPCPRNELNSDHARDALRMMADLPDALWIDVLGELQRVAYPADFLQSLAIAAMEHPSPPVRQQAYTFYPHVAGGAELIGDHLTRESDADIIITILRAANSNEHLSQAVWPLLDTFAQTESDEIAESVAELLTNDFLMGSQKLGSFALANPVYRNQLLSRVDSIPDFAAVEEAYLEILKRSPPNNEQLAKLLRLLNLGPSDRSLQLLRKLSKNPRQAMKRTALERMLEAGDEGRDVFLEELEQQTDPAMVEFFFAELRQWLKRAHPEIFVSGDAAENPLPQTILDQVVSTVSMPQPPVRRLGYALFDEFDPAWQQPLLTTLYRRLENESDVALRREIIEFFLAVPTDGIEKVISWRPHETDSDLIRDLDKRIEQHEQEQSRMAQEKREQIEAQMKRVQELVAASRTATNADAMDIQEELIGLGRLSLQPVARMLYEPSLENRYAVTIGFEVLESAGTRALPILEVLAKCPNEKVWRQAVDSIHDSGPGAEPYLRSLLKVPRLDLNAAVLRKLIKFAALEDQTLLAIARLLMVEESGIDNMAYAILIKHESSRDLLQQASQSPRVRESLRGAIQRRLEKNRADPVSEE